MALPLIIPLMGMIRYASEVRGFDKKRTTEVTMVPTAIDRKELNRPFLMALPRLVIS
jgi:hypothetical protein